MSTHRNPVDDKTRSARKRYGARAALWGLLTSLYAAGRDHEAKQLEDELRRGVEPETVLDHGLALPDLGRTGEGLIGWVAHRYHLIEKDPGAVYDRWGLQGILPGAAYPVMEWSQRTRPRPNLFDFSVHEAYEKAKAFLKGRESNVPRQGPVVFRFEDGWTVQELNDKALLVDEGKHQHICVGQEQHGYPAAVANGSIVIYSLRDPDGRPHVTMTWEPGTDQLTEGTTANNGEISDPALMKRVAEFAEDHLGVAKLYLVQLGVIPGRMADLRKVDWSGKDLGDANLSGADLSGGDLSRANLGAVNMSGAKIADADLRGAYLCGANLIGTDFSGSDLTNAIMDRAKISANFENATLQRARLYGTDLSESKLDGADVRGARWDSKTVWPPGFQPWKAGAVLVNDETSEE